MSLGSNMMLGPELDTWDTVEDPSELSPAHQPVSELPFNPGMQLTGIGSHPQLVERLGSALLAAYQSSGILAVAGPFPGRAPGHYEHPGGSAAPKVNGVAPFLFALIHILSSSLCIILVMMRSKETEISIFVLLQRLT